MNRKHHVSALNPVAESFSFFREDHATSLGLNGTFIPGYASHVQRSDLNKIYMTYCLDTQEVKCDHATERRVVCKVPCKYSKMN